LWDASKLDQYLGLVRQFSRDNAVPLVDAYQSIPEDGFVDLQHMNQIGASALTRMVEHQYVASHVPQAAVAGGR
jgi:hypothetical protein